VEYALVGLIIAPIALNVMAYQESAK